MCYLTWPSLVDISDHELFLHHPPQKIKGLRTPSFYSPGLDIENPQRDKFSTPCSTHIYIYKYKYIPTHMSCLFTHLRRYMRFALVFVDKDCETDFSSVQLQLSPVSTKAQRRDCKGQIAGSIWSHRVTNFAIRLGWPATTCKLHPWPGNIGQLPVLAMQKFGSF